MAVKAQELAGEPLMVVERAPAAIQCAQRCEIRHRLERKLSAEVLQQIGWHHTHCIERPAAHAQKADVQGETEPVSRLSALLDRRALGPRKREKGL
jgi:hypothetical protein